MAVDTADTPNDRLNSWKEISAHIGRSVRTCQRWEKDFHLPIHRLGKGQGEILYALTDELEAWQRTPEGYAAYQKKRAISNGAPTSVAVEPIESPAGRLVSTFKRARIAVVVVVLVAAAGLVFGWSALARPSPFSFRITAGKLVALDSRARAIWNYSFDAPLAECAASSSRTSPATRYGVIDYSLEECPDRVITEDVDSDGNNEVIVARQKGVLFCLTADGQLRSTYSVSHPVDYYETLDNQKPMPDPGVKKYSPPFSVSRLVVMKNRAGQASVWIVGHHPEWYPSFVQELDLSGKTPNVLSDYWSPGFISLVERGRVGGHDMTLIGAAHNETGGSSLAVFIDSPVRGTPPTLTGDKKCANCPTGRPDRFFVFPRSAAIQSVGAVSLVHQISGLGKAGFTVEVCSVLDPQVRAIVDCPAVDYYGFDSELRIVEAHVGGGYFKHQRRFEEMNFLPPWTREWTDGQLFPVYSWRGEHMEKLLANMATVR